MPMHKKLAQTLFVKATEGGDIYLDTYEVFTLLAFTGTKDAAGATGLVHRQGGDVRDRT